MIKDNQIRDSKNSSRDDSKDSLRQEKCNITPLLRFENANFEFERKRCSVVKWETGSTTGWKVSRGVADGAVMIFRVVDSNVSLKFFAFHSNVSDFPAVVAHCRMGPVQMQLVVSCPVR